MTDNNSELITVQIKPGVTHGAHRQHKPGDVIQVTPQVYKAFGDKFTRVTVNQPVIAVNDPDDDPPNEIDLTGLNVADTLALLEKGEVTAQQVYDAEMARPEDQRRVSIMRAVAQE